MEEINVTPHRAILEPVARNTAPAAALAALSLLAEDEDAVMLLLPSDHVVHNHHAFDSAVRAGLIAVQDDHLVIFGCRPDKPETGYGYIRTGEPLAMAPGCIAVERFVEKPNRTNALKFLSEGGYLWNAGTFLFRARTYISELERLQPEMVAACRKSIENSDLNEPVLRASPEAFAKADDLSIDYAVMEHTSAATVVPLDVGWSDVGAWAALHELNEADQDGNVARGNVLLEDVRGSYVRSENRLVTVLGLEDIVVVETTDAVLVAGKDSVQDVKLLTDRMKESNLDELVNHKEVSRPWGSYQSIDQGDRFQVKRISVAPGGILSLQAHFHRAEHWIVVSGTARVTLGEESFLLQENQSTYIEIGEVHRLENPGRVPLELIEVQTGVYLGEDDIVRYEDSYGRVPEAEDTVAAPASKAATNAA